MLANYLKKLNSKQLEAVEHQNGPLLIVAGAGSGKTMTLTSRIIKLLAIGVPPEKILAITFTNKAAEEMRKRVFDTQCQMSNVKCQMLFIGTFHSFGVSILRKEAKHVGRTANFTIFDGNDSLSLFKKVIKNLNLEKDKTQLGKLYYEIGKIKNTLIGHPESFDYSQDKLCEGSLKDVNDDIVSLVFKEYERALERNNGFDFDDLIEKPVRLFSAQPAMLKKYQQRFNYIMVDEFQDTNTAQYLLIKLLAQEHNNLNVVGDDAQSIYGWRYANFHNFLDFEDDWPKAKTVFLEENYRSVSNILEAANEVIKNNKLQKQKNLWTQNPAGNRIIVINADSDEEEARWIANKILILSRSHPELVEGSQCVQVSEISRFRSPSFTRDGGLKENAILYRTNAQSRALEQALIYQQIPYRIYGGIKFYERKEIKDIMAGLRLAANPKDEVSWDRLQKNFSKTKQENLIKDLPRLAKELSVAQLINFIINNTDYLDYLDRNFKNAEERIENLQELIKFADQFTSSVILSVSEGSKDSSLRRPPTGGGGIQNDVLLQRFLEQTSLTQAHDNPQGQAGVNLMTIHLAKGLEFDNVFISGCAEGLLPHQKSYFSSEQLEEERRLMYVAMTRARKNLFLTLAGTPSRFLYEIPSELTEFVDLNEQRKELPSEDERWIDYN